MYKRGFGTSTGEYWIGNGNIHQLTSHGNYTLKIVLGDWNNMVKYAEYIIFNVADESYNYCLTIGGYLGTRVIQWLTIMGRASVRWIKIMITTTIRTVLN